MSPPPVDPARRRLLLLAPALGAAAGCGILGGNRTDAGFDAGTPTTVGALAVGAFYCPSPDVANSYVLGRDVDGFYAFTNTCTHQGCPLSCPDRATGHIVCPCHGSTYNANGDLLMGHDGTSAVNQASLKHLVITFEGTGPTATVVVDITREETDRTARAAPPA